MQWYIDKSNIWIKNETRKISRDKWLEIVIVLWLTIILSQNKSKHTSETKHIKEIPGGGADPETYQIYEPWHVISNNVAFWQV